MLQCNRILARVSFCYLAVLLITILFAIYAKSLIQYQPLKVDFRVLGKRKYGRASRFPFTRIEEYCLQPIPKQSLLLYGVGANTEVCPSQSKIS